MKTTYKNQVIQNSNKNSTVSLTACKSILIYKMYFDVCYLCEALWITIVY